MKWNINFICIVHLVHVHGFLCWHTESSECDTSVVLLLFQSNEVKSSHAMELESLKRGLEWVIDTNNMTVSDIITDRHGSVKRYIREEKPDINHWFDVWHAAKGMYTLLHIYIHLG